MTDLIRQHKEVQQQIAEAKERAVKLQLVADLEQRQAHFEACLSAGKGPPAFPPLYPLALPSCLIPLSYLPALLPSLALIRLQSCRRMLVAIPRNSPYLL